MDVKKISQEIENDILEAGIDDINREAADEIRSVLQEIMDIGYEDDLFNENELYNILMEDDHLLEELVDKTAALNIVLGAYGDDEISKEDVEKTYLSAIDVLFELSKTVNPIAGFGKDRLLAGLSMVEYFEENMWPVSTRITAENAEVFSQFIPEELFDDVINGRKYAIGALRLIGEETFAAGAIVFSVDEAYVYDTPAVRLEWIEVHSDMRRRGVGNMLMAEIMEPYIKKGDIALVTEIPVIRQNTDNRDEADIVENFLDSWKIAFSVTSGRHFKLDISRLAGNREINGSFKGAVPLARLGDKGGAMVRDFFRKQNNEYDRELINTPYSFFDPHISTCIVEDNLITSLFLVHRFESGSYRYEALRCPGGYDGPEMKKLLRCAYGSYLDCEDSGGIFGIFDSEEGRDAVTELLPEMDMPMYLSGSLLVPDEPITTEMWDGLRREAGFSDEKIPDEEMTDKDMTDESIKLMSGALKAI